MRGRDSGGMRAAVAGSWEWRVVWPVLLGISLAVAAVVASGSLSSVRAQEGPPAYQKQEPPLDTRWTDEVGPGNALPEYPRPQMTRDRWQNLNGVWQFAAADEGDEPPFGRPLEERVLVPYPIESALSGIKRHEDRMFYRRTFSVPKDWRNNKQRLLLHFGAVDYLAVVYVNGQRVGSHKGGYDDFTIDVTGALKNAGQQEIVVAVTDLTDRGNRPFARPYVGGGQPVGKQTLRPGGIFYTASSGIWQTVWMEPVAPARISRLDMTPNLEDDTLRLNVRAGNAKGKLVEAIAYDDGKQVGRVVGPANRELRLPVRNPKLWSPDDPFLYDLRVRLREGTPNKLGKYQDTVGSYFGMRSVGVREGEDGKPRMMLNGEFLANVGTLDQGYWPDGVYTAPTDAALKFDLRAHKDLGYNMVRKHIKVEPDRWFYHADRLGLLVWQDMPSFSPVYDPSPGEQEQFEEELRQMVNEHKSFTSVTTWVPYNEGWGELDQETTARATEQVKALDPSRLVNTHSGVNCCESQGDSGAGEIYDQHNYQDPPLPVPFDDRATVAGEYGGVALKPPEGHEYDPPNSVAPYGAEPSPEALTERYEELQDRLRQGVQSCGVSAGVYTEITDLEYEINGMYTYDRDVFKPSSMDRIRAANEAVIAASETAGTPGGNLPPGTPGPNGISYYPFEEGSGTVTEDEGENDGDDHDAALANGPTWTTGQTGNGLQFNGNDQWVDTGASILDTTGNYSVAAWVKLDRTNAFATAVSQDTAGPQSAFFLQYHLANNRFQFSFPSGSTRSDEAPVAGRWYHLVGVRDAATGTYTLYVDGAEQDTAPACLADASSGNTVIGRAQFNDGPVDYWPGGIDQVHVYDRALSDAEVTELYGSGR